MNVGIPIDLIQSLCAFFLLFVGFHGNLMTELKLIQFPADMHSFDGFRRRKETKNLEIEKLIQNIN